jgi:hypothetical protein
MALLTMEKIFGLKLDADWAVLSACNTASGDGAGAEATAAEGARGDRRIAADPPQGKRADRASQTSRSCLGERPKNRR